VRSAPSPSVSFAAAFACGGLIGLGPVFANALDAPALAGAAWRMALGTVLLLPAARHWRRIPWKGALAGGVAYSISQATYFVAAQMTSVAVSS